MKPLTPDTLASAAAALAEADPDLARIYHKLGPPPLWDRAPGFPTLIHIILEQQVSLASAQAAMTRLVEASGTLTPERFLQFDDVELKAIGFSRQKTGYGRGLARLILDGALDLDALARSDDNAAREMLMSIKGIGRWSADIYLLMALCRPDIWPVGDLALVAGIVEVKRLPARPTSQEFEALGEAWRPLRSVAARMLWQDYLHKRGQYG